MILEFTGILQMYVNALNSPEGIPKVGSAWEQVMKNTYQTATNRAIEEYKSNMATLKFPIEDSIVQMRHRVSYENAVKLFKQLTKLDSDDNVYQQRLEELSVCIIVIIFCIVIIQFLLSCRSLLHPILMVLQNVMEVFCTTIVSRTSKYLRKSVEHCFKI